MPQHLRVFISSPGDVPDERLRADLVVDKVAQDFSRFFTFETYRWEHEPMLASGHFQDAIDPPSKADIVILILWSRLGTPLPEKTGTREYRGLDGRAPVTGTEWEYEDALKAARERGAPDILAFRNVSPAAIDTRDPAVREKSIEQLDALDAFWKRHFADRGVFLAAYDEYQSLDEFARRLEESLRKLIERRIAALPGAQAQAAIWPGDPFRGLEPYEFEHAAIFFGRDGLVAKAAEQLAAGARAGTAFLLVTGSSGSGKSSLVKAALVPRLMKPQRIQGTAFLRRVIFRPGDGGGDVILGLVGALTRSGQEGVGLPEMLAPGQDAAKLAAHLRAAVDEPGFAFAGALGHLTQDGRREGRLLAFEEAKLILVIDQLEELFTTSATSVADRQLFVRLIGNLARSGALWVIATLRADFWHRAAEIPQLVALAQGTGRLDVSPPSPAELAEMIRKPAQAAGLGFEVHGETGLGLDSVLAEHAANEPGVLPLLSFTLDGLYAKDVVKDGGRVLTFATYESLGGLEGAIANRADAIVAGLPAAAQAAVPRVLRAVATISSTTDQVTVARAAPLANFPEGSAARQVVDALTAGRLLVASEENATATVRLAHEALISHWRRARDQLVADGRDLQTRALVERQQARWAAAAGRAKRQLLLRDPDLANAIDLDNRWGDEIDGMTRGYIQISRNRARRRQQLTAVAAVVFAFVAAAAVYGQYRVRQERAQAERNFDAALQTASSYANANQSLNNGDSASALRQVQAAEATMTNLTRQNPTEGMLITLADSQTLAGDVLRARGNLSDALTEYRSSLAIREAVVAEHPDKVEILGIGHGRLGYLLADKGDAADAVNEFRTALSIREKLVAEGKGDLVTRRNVLIGHRDVANMLYRLGDPSGAIAEYRTALAVASDPANRDLANTLTVQWDVIGIHQLLGRADFAAHDNTDALAEFRSALDLKQRAMLNDLGIIQKQQELALSHSEIGDVLMAQANLNEAAASYGASFDTLRPIVARFRSPPLVESIGTLSYKLILAHDFSKALEVSDFAISIALKLTWLYTNRAHALMFLGRVDEAREVYLQHRGEKTLNDKPWEAAIAEDFTQFRSAGLTNPLMDEIQKRFAAGD